MPKVSSNLDLVATLVNNLLENASRHAFSPPSQTDRVSIQLQMTEGYLGLTIMNNGRPFSRTFTKDKFISKFSKSQASEGSGLGGYDINRIATYLDAKDWQLDTIPNHEMTCTFLFTFPLI